MEIGACFYINLDQKQERRRHIEAQLVQLGDLPRERWPAVRPTQRDLVTLYGNVMRRGVAPYLRDYLDSRGERERYFGVLGCNLSHIGLMQHIAEHRDDSEGAVLVLEDDVVLEAGFLDVLRERLRLSVLASTDWDLIRIDCWAGRGDGFQVAEDVYHLTSPWGAPAHFSGSHALLYRPSRVGKLLSLLEKRPLQDFDGVWDDAELTRSMAHFVVYTGHCQIATFPSDVRPSGRNRRFWRRRRWIGWALGR